MKHQTQDIPVVLTIAGSDSSGGAGIQADIKTISATGSYACSVITAVTAQNTQGVDAVHPLPADIVGQQLDSVLNDLNVVAVKIGMLSQPDIIEVIAEKLSIFQPRWLVIDPVMISTSGTHLLEPSATGILKNILLPMADLITPNLPEALMLTSHAESDCLPAMPLLTEQLRKIHPKGILLKGGHSEDKTFVKICSSPRTNNSVLRVKESQPAIRMVRGVLSHRQLRHFWLRAIRYMMPWRWLKHSYLPPYQMQTDSVSDREKDRCITFTPFIRVCPAPEPNDEEGESANINRNGHIGLFLD